MLLMDLTFLVVVDKNIVVGGFVDGFALVGRYLMKLLYLWDDYGFWVFSAKNHWFLYFPLPFPQFSPKNLASLWALLLKDTCGNTARARVSKVYFLCVF